MRVRDVFDGGGECLCSFDWWTGVTSAKVEERI